MNSPSWNTRSKSGKLLTKKPLFERTPTVRAAKIKLEEAGQFETPKADTNKSLFASFSQGKEVPAFQLLSRRGALRGGRI
jgi:hypothetical protein